MVVHINAELVIWVDGRLAFERLTPRLNRTPAAVARLADQAPATAVVCDLLRWSDTDYLTMPYARRRTDLEALFAARLLEPPFNLCPSTSETPVAEQWLRDWVPLGIEGLVLKDTRARYRPGGQGAQGWRKWRVRHTAEGIVAAVTGRPSRPRTVLLGRYDGEGRLRYAGRSTTVPAAVAARLGPLLTPAGEGHPWQGRRFSAAWGSTEPLDVDLAVSELVVEVSADVSLDAAGRWRHPVRIVRDRPDLTPADVTGFGP
ncbi:ATP dependent DNA ligase domain-containing protein [Actinacidiphila yanglinensis]|uniref:ATP dependent DNA ligase domain-containing protein n=1 Tax=Actinacidiphila yanglinensis TaxID=310779 RepID=A0A1H6EA43_9ACTN|nr:ATP-dependent DNA ligase [Actinacidiphila yanglinensis]SEG94151.1 ATP dependent DNA ligase domain-containing protein [Actinacidiphila yanglinensis]